VRLVTNHLRSCNLSKFFKQPTTLIIHIYASPETGWNNRTWYNYVDRHLSFDYGATGSGRSCKDCSYSIVNSSNCGNRLLHVSMLQN
jgi:hypothetical protein